MRHSWPRSILDSILEQKEKPVIVLYHRVLEMLGEQLRADVASDSFLLKFRVASNSDRYETSEYEYGTSRFREAARKAGPENCLQKMYS